MHYRNEDDFWNAYYDRKQEAEEKAMAYAEDLAGDIGYEFDSEKEREECIERIFEQYMAEAGF